MRGRFLLDTHVIVQMGNKGGLEAMLVRVTVDHLDRAQRRSARDFVR